MAAQHQDDGVGACPLWLAAAVSAASVRGVRPDAAALLLPAELLLPAAAAVLPSSSVAAVDAVGEE